VWQFKHSSLAGAAESTASAVDSTAGSSVPVAVSAGDFDVHAVSANRAIISKMAVFVFGKVASQFVYYFTNFIPIYKQVIYITFTY
jgi:hypothetical protein